MRHRITLHAHSQGAIIAAVAQTRLGDFAIPHPTDYPTHETVADWVNLISYGGGANMLDWGPTHCYHTYLHQVNEKDRVAMVPGMGDPFQTRLRQDLLIALPLGELIGLPTGLVLTSGPTSTTSRPFSRLLAPAAPPP